jgi:hypothetical protein
LPLRYHLWYSPQDKYFYENCYAFFDGYAVTAHILSHNAKAFLTLQLLNAGHPKPFFILPDCDALQFYSPDQFDNVKGATRVSWGKLKRQYGGKTDQILEEHRPLVPADLSNQNELDAFCSALLEFQRNPLLESFQSLARLLPSNSSPPKPEFLVAPYFYFENRTDAWYALAIRALRSSLKFRETERLFGVIFCSKDCLAPTNLSSIVTDFSGTGIDGVLLWVDDFDEHRESEILLDGLKSLVYSLSQLGKKVWVLYGGHFASLLSYFGLDGYASAICTRDRKSARPLPPMRGPAGGPVPRYYVPRLHSKLVQEDAQRFLAQFPSFRCNCSLCLSQNIVNIPIPPNDRQARANLRKLMREHFLLVRNSQLAQLGTQSPVDSFDELVQASATTSQSPLVDSSHLRHWHRVLSRAPI